ncbi:MAG: hypothetical protein KAS32_29105 [Candidatus Peribacteraceae bacterium]|nr:hypothetical protein [Candidatus Peribacteraceae bacterium]
MRNSDPVIFWPGAQADQDIKQRMDANYQDSIATLQTQWLQADYDQRTYLGDSDIWGSLYPSGTLAKRKMFNFNLVHSSIMMASGHQRRNRKSTICIPVKSPVQQTADQFTKCLYHVHRNGGYEVYSDAFEQASLVKGFGLVSIFPDFTTDPVSPDIKMRYLDFCSILIDPYFRQKDLSDCRYIWNRQYFTKEEAKHLYPDHAEAIEDIPFGGSPTDGKFYYMPENYGLNNSKLIAFDEYWYLSTREAIYAIDNQTQETKELFGDEEDIRVVMLQLGDRIRLVRKPKQTVRRAILVNGHLLSDEVRPYGIDRYPYVGWYGNFNPDTIYYGYKFKGIVRDMRDAQFLFDYRKGTDLDILSSQQQGLLVEQGSLVTPEDGLNTGNGRMLIRKKGSSPDSVIPMEIHPPSPVMIQMEDMLKTVMREISGINDELLGAAVDDKAGVLSMLRQGAGLTTLQKYFDQADESQRRCGDIIIEMIQHFWSYGKIKQVIGEDPTPEFDDKAFFTYGAKIVQGVLTETQEQLELAQLFELQARFGEIFPPDEIVQAMTIQNKDRIVEKMVKAQQAQQEMAQKRAELEMQQIQVDNETKLSYARSKDAYGHQQMAKIQTDIAIAEDKIKRAHNEDTESLLNVIKAIKELEGMDLTQLSQKLQILQGLQPEAQVTPTATTTKLGV